MIAVREIIYVYLSTYIFVFGLRNKVYLVLGNNFLLNLLVAGFLDNSRITMLGFKYCVINEKKNETS